MKNITIEDLKRAINAISYDKLENDEIIVEVGYLLQIKRYIEFLEGKVKHLETQNKKLNGEVNRLTGKLIECENKNPDRFDRYI